MIRRSPRGARMTRHRVSLESLGWTSAVETFRPFLSYNELGATFDEGPDRVPRPAFADPRSRRYRGRAGTAEARPTPVPGRSSTTRRAGSATSSRSSRTSTIPAPRPRSVPSRVGPGISISPSERSQRQARPRKPRRATSSTSCAISPTCQPPNPDEVRRLAGELEGLAEREAAVAGTPAGEARDTSSCCGSPCVTSTPTAKATAPSAASGSRCCRRGAPGRRTESAT